MKQGIFSVDGKFYAFTSKLVDVVVLSLLWLVGCLPVVTIITSTSSMYHVAVQCIRYDRGSIFTEFKEAYRNNLRQGIGLTVFYGILGALIAFVDYQLFIRSTDVSGPFFVLSLGMLILSAVYILNLLWIIPVFSRFSNTFGNIIKLNYVVAVRYLIRSIPMLLVIVAAVILFLASNELFLIIPALVAFVNSYLAEPALRRYMPKQEEDNGDWRYGFM